MDRSGVAVIYELNFIFLTAALWNLLRGTSIQVQQPFRFPFYIGKREIFHQRSSIFSFSCLLLFIVFERELTLN